MRTDVPTQSTAVSPPPMTITRLPCTSYLMPVCACCTPLSASRFAFCVTLRKSMACTMFFSSRPSVLRMSRHIVAPVATITASFCMHRSDIVTSLPTSVLYLNSIPSSWSSFSRRRTFPVLSSFIEGMPYMSRPPPRSARSMTLTKWPARFSCWAAARPAGPEPMIAMRRRVRSSGGCGLIQSLEKPYSMIDSSMDLIATGSSLMPRTHASSQGAGQVVPVNSGKLLVSSRRSSAFFHSPSCTSWFHVGMRLPSGQPPPPWLGVWHVGVPQSMQRADCVL
mmetsp:Transcript_84330/g.217161  ORF Transcript_84330/g.217161 Transcript_84330/m.217161 type:complete len:280 (+) Transcript_84330:1007-1846(+)